MILRVIDHPYEFDMKNLCITTMNIAICMI
jgi:hypothetical protein